MPEPPLADLDDQTLARQAANGCRASFSVLVDRYGGRLLTFLSHRTDASEAEDLVQETLLRAWSNLHRYDGRGTFSTWLFTIGHRLAISQHRARRLRSAGPLPLDQVDTKASRPDRTAMRHEAREDLWHFAQVHLSEDAYTALWLHYAEDMPARDVAQVMSKSVIGTRVRLHRARAALLKAFRQVGFECCDMDFSTAPDSSDRSALRLAPEPAGIGPANGR